MLSVLLNSTANTSINYLPIVIQLVVAIGFVAFMMSVTHLLGPKRRTSDKLANFESGIESVGNARQPMAIKYFLVAILFVLFDLEIALLFPWAVSILDLGWEGFATVCSFLFILLIGFIYEWKKGALEWD